MNKAVSDWHFTTSAGISTFTTVVIVLAIIILCFYIAKGGNSRIKPGLRTAAAILRALALGGGLLLFIGLGIRFLNSKKETSTVAILVDTSKSMTYGVSGSRFEKAKKIIANSKKALKNLEQKYKLVWYMFGDTIKRVKNIKDIFKKPKYFNNTDIRKVLKDLVISSQKSSLAGVVLLSDGTNTETENSNDATWDMSWAKDIKVPVNTVAVTNRGEIKDIFISNVKVNSMAFMRNPLRIDVSIKNTGLKNKKTEVMLWRHSTVERRSATFNNGLADVSFTYTPTSLGRHMMTVSVPVQKNDEIPTNNKTHLNFNVLRDKIRILHLAGKPSWDVRFLRQFFSGWPKIDLVSFYVLRTPNQSESYNSKNMALIPFPTRGLFEDHLHEFDIIIFQDFSPQVVRVDRYLDKVAKFISGGGGAIFIAGERGFELDSMNVGLIKDTLPVIPYAWQIPLRQKVSTISFSPKLTDTGKHHPIMDFAKDADNPNYFASLPDLDGIGLAAGLAPSALALATTPLRPETENPDILFAVKEWGKGRTMSIASDSLWKWRFTGPMNGSNQNTYESFYKGVVKWLVHDPKLDHLKVSAHPSNIKIGNDVCIEMVMSKRSYMPFTNAKLKLTIYWTGADGTENHKSFDAHLDENGKYITKWKPNREGPHRVEVKFDDENRAVTHFLVEKENKESINPEPNIEFLQEIARITNGSFQKNIFNPNLFNLNNAQRERLITLRDIPLWDNPFLIGFIILLLTASWILDRKIS